MKTTFSFLSGATEEAAAGATLAARSVFFFRGGFSRLAMSAYVARFGQCESALRA
jgi:hypothetical protein